MVQKPSVRPGRSPRERPTGSPQSLREQNRLRSGTSGSASTAERGSGRGTPGTLTRPAPSRLRPEAAVFDCELRTDTEREPPSPAPAVDRESRPETDLREDEERAEVRELGALCGAPWVMPVGGDESDPSGATTGARPQVSQYVPPPPTSSYAPVQPGRWQAPAVMPAVVPVVLPLMNPPCGR
ncbi:hypothetical protein GCM10010357_61230 [Streptomyces luteireticuli]|uniref:Uncharacterized protein n=1 Tax=Streptomyces luteireticuli TaxID=173858 RepID=A0ABP3IZF4_9ACTN